MKKILIVDDNDLILDCLSKKFKDAGTIVLTASGGKAALRMIEKSGFDLCILDVQLPDMSGLDIMTRLRSTSPGTRIIIMTGGEVTDAMMKSIRENAHLLLSKPFGLDPVRTFVNRVLETGRTLSRDESDALKAHAPFIKWLAEDNRKHERKPAARRITCFAYPSQDDKTAVYLNVNLLDISDAGMGIRTDCRLKSGSIISVCDADVHCVGVVRWIANAKDPGSYHAGIQFVAPAEPVYSRSH
jgi:CheY-like chemotaxis protein